MAEKKRKKWLILSFVVFIVYLFVASSPIPEETVLINRWIVSTPQAGSENRDQKVLPASTGTWIPFKIADRFGYFDPEGHFAFNQPIDNYVSLSSSLWAEYGSQDDQIDVHSFKDDGIIHLKNPHGYPFFADNKIFIVGNEQNSVESVDNSGKVLWKYDFSAPITALDAESDLVLIGGLNGTIEVLNNQGKSIFSFEAGGSRIPVIVGARLSWDGKKIALISGIDRQRFILLERSGVPYKVSYHEYLTAGFRRPVFLTFIDRGRTVAFEREKGLGIFDISHRKSYTIPLDGSIVGMEEEGSSDRLFLLTSEEKDGRFNLIGIGLPDTVILTSSFRGSTAFIDRRENRLFLGNDKLLAAFDFIKR